MTEIATVEQRLKMQLGELLFSSLVAGAQIDALVMEAAALKAKIAKLEASIAEKIEAAEPLEATG